MNCSRKRKIIYETAILFLTLVIVCKMSGRPNFLCPHFHLCRSLYITVPDECIYSNMCVYLPVGQESRAGIAGRHCSTL